MRRFYVTVICLDLQFKPVKDRKNLDVPINLVSKAEHVSKIERFHRVLKERARCYYAMLPFSTLPRMMAVHLMIAACFCTNSFAWLKGVSQVIPPLTIVEGTVISCNLHFCVIHGEFVQTYEGANNGMSQRTIDAIALGPNGNMQGGLDVLVLQQDAF